MGNVVKLDLPDSATDGAIKRMMALMQSGYLPPLFAADLDLLIKGAMCWDMLQQDRAKTAARPEYNGGDVPPV